MNNASVMTAKQFRKASNGGTFSRRPKAFRTLDDMIGVFHASSDPRRKFAYLVAIWLRSMAMLRHRKTKARRRVGLILLERQVDAEIKRLQPIAAQAGWTSTPRSLSPQARTGGASLSPHAQVAGLSPVARSASPATTTWQKAAPSQDRRRSTATAGAHRATPEPASGWVQPASHHDAGALSPRALASGHRQNPAMRQPSAASQRWDKVRNLMTAPAGSGHTRMLTGDHYWLEFIDPEHRFGDLLQRYFDAWDQDAAAVASGISFWDWLNTGRVRDDMEEVLQKSIAQGILKGTAVDYLDENERKAFVVGLENGMLLDADGDPFHTGNLSTHASGAGWGIWVLAPDRTFYSGSHEPGKFHHSSFLAGTPVKAAGEWIVDKGQLRAISNKSGHYKPGDAETLHALFILHRAGVDLARVALKTGPDTYRNAADVLRAGGKPDPGIRPMPAPTPPGPWSPPDDVPESEYVSMARGLIVPNPSHYVTMQARSS